MHIRLRRTLAIALLLIVALAAPPAPTHAQGEDGRPYLELPFEGGTSYRVSCAYTCYQHYNAMTYAVDFAMPAGVPILAAAAGEVRAVTWEVGMPLDLNLGDALIVYIDHGDGWFTRYVHLDGLTVAQGDRVEMGQVIGYSGATGASAAHLHFELRYGSSLRSPSVPIDELFGEAPAEGQYYESNNYAFTGAMGTVEVPFPAATAQIEILETPTPVLTLPSPTPLDPTLLPSTPLPSPSAGLTLSGDGTDIVAGQAVTVSFTMRNSASERSNFAMVGIGSRRLAAEGDGPSEAGGMAEAVLSFDRAIKLNPGNSYDFSHEITFDEAGDYELFIFVLDAAHQLVDPGTDANRLTLTVRPAAAALYLPLVAGSVADGPSAVDAADDSALTPDDSSILLDLATPDLPAGADGE